MPENQTGGSKLGAISGAIITVAFFLPWVRACGTERSGYDIASNSMGNVQEPRQYWLVLSAGILCMVLVFAMRNRIGGAIARLIIGAISFLPILNIWLNVQQKGGMMEILYGGWLTVAGYVGIVLSFLLDVFGEDNANASANSSQSRSSSLADNKGYGETLLSNSIGVSSTIEEVEKAMGKPQATKNDEKGRLVYEYPTRRFEFSDGKVGTVEYLYPKE